MRVVARPLRSARSAVGRRPIKVPNFILPWSLRPGKRLVEAICDKGRCDHPEAQLILQAWRPRYALKGGTR